MLIYIYIYIYIYHAKMYIYIHLFIYFIYILNSFVKKKKNCSNKKDTVQKEANIFANSNLHHPHEPHGSMF